MTTPLDPEAQAALLGEITDRLAFVLPAGWNRLQVDYAAVGDRISCVGLLFTERGEVADWPPPAEIADRFTALRAGMAAPGFGAWLQATYWIDYPDYYSIDYDRSARPPFYEPATAEDVARELELFPRDPEHVPQWMRE
ncbi:hypothetical protein [Actinosynnema sp. NPDC020468]|uniref:hypothetical protein n=1 Tax=Actinosynnema sp. NPDC020468 TaxID=3154488 RepID=UPI0033F6B1F0